MRFSRHAKNNMRLYNIAEEDIVRAIEAPDSKGREGNRLIALKQFSNKFAGYALKVVFEKSGGSVTVITAYPLKRKHWR
jgi:hypothetical protein